MSKKVHIQSFKTSIWGPSSQQSVYVEKNSSNYFRILYSMQTFLNSALYKSSSVKVLKAPTKRGLQKPFYFSSVQISRKTHNSLCYSAILFGFPRKNYIGKYFCIRMKRSRGFRGKKRFSSKLRRSI